MARITLEEQPEYALLPVDSILHLKVDECTVKDVQGRNGDWQKLEFKFKILGIQATGDGSPVENYDSLIGGPIWGSVPFRLTDSPENRLRQWAEAIFGMELGLGFELDTDNFVRREVRGLTSQYEKRNKDPRTGLPFKAHQIESLLAMGGAQPAQAAPAQNPWASAPQQPAQQPVQQPVQNWAGSGVPAGGSWEDPPF